MATVNTTTVPRTRSKSRLMAGFRPDFGVWRSVFVAAPVLAWAVPAFASGPQAGPWLDSYDLTLAPGHRTEGLGPLTYHESKDTQETYGVPPLFSHVEDS